MTSQICLFHKDMLSWSYCIHKMIDPDLIESILVVKIIDSL